MEIIKDYIPFPTNRIIYKKDKDGKTVEKILNVRPATKYKKTSITIHSTANTDSYAKGERGWLTNKNNHSTSSWHYVVDENQVIQAIPDEETAFHAGKNDGNKYSIGIEICETGDRKKVLMNTVDLVVELLKKHNLTLKDIKKHFDWTGKDCPRILINPKYIKDGLDWNWFMKQIEVKFTTSEIPKWKTDIMQKGFEAGIFTDKSRIENPNESVEIWEVVAMILNAKK